MQPTNYGFVVTIPLLYVQVSSRKVRREKTETGVMVIETDAYCTLVTRHASETGLQYNSHHF